MHRDCIESCSCINVYSELNMETTLGLRLLKIFMLSSAEHEILNAHKYKNIKKFGIFLAQVSLECYFSLLMLINVKMPTIVGILTFMSRKNFMSMKFFL